MCLIELSIDLTFSGSDNLIYFTVESSNHHLSTMCSKPNVTILLYRENLAMMRILEIDISWITIQV